MSCGVSAASQRQIRRAASPRLVRHPWKGSRRYHFGSEMQPLETTELTRCPLASAKSLNFQCLEDM